MTLVKLYKDTTEILQRAGADSPAFDAIWIIESVTGCGRHELIESPEKELSEDAKDKAFALAQRRAQGEPLQYLTGNWEFMGRKFYVGEGVLIPRDDTEVVVRCVLNHLDKVSHIRPPQILDLCSGSGIIAITLKAMYPDAQVTAVEISPPALHYLEKNAKENNTVINILSGDIFECADSFEDGTFDLIISNPPYVTKEDMENLQREVRYEPELALYGGDDGCDFYRRIVPLYTQKLTKGGMLAFEYDSSQASTIGKLMTMYNFKNINIFDDLGGVHRAINGTVFE